MYYIGIDLGGTNIAVGVIDEKYNLLVKGSVPTGAERDGKEIIKDMADLCAKLVAEANLTFDDIEYAGIAAPGSIDPEKGIVTYANNLPFNNFAIADILKSFIPIKKVYLENDANAAALGEAVAGAARGVKHAVMITLGTGVGGGIIIDNKVYSGFNAAGAELGHIVIEYEGRPCSCGRKGCWEAYSSATGLINMTREKIEECMRTGRPSAMIEMSEGGKTVSGRTSFNAMRAGDEAASEVVDMYIRYLACGLINIVNIFQPEVISLGGGISNERENLLKPLMPFITAQQYGAGAVPQTDIRIAQLGNDAGIIGAALLGMQK